MHAWLDQGQFEQIAEMAVCKKRVLGTLVSLTFDRDEQIGWRAVEAMGLAASRIAQRDPQYARNHLRRLHWLLSEESGGVCWRAPEAMAEIVRNRPKLFADYVPIVVFLILSLAKEDLEPFRTGALWVIGRLGALAGDHVPAVLPAVTSALDSSDPRVRGMAVWCLEQVGQARLLASRTCFRTRGRSICMKTDIWTTPACAVWFGGRCAMDRKKAEGQGGSSHHRLVGERFSSGWQRPWPAEAAGHFGGNCIATNISGALDNPG